VGSARGEKLMPKPVVFFVTPELQQVLDNLPADEPRSRLEPFRSFILRWRREGRSYRRIQEILADKCNVRVSSEGLRKFVRSRARPRQVQPEIETEPPTMPPVKPPPPATPGKRLSAEERAAQVAYIRSLNKPELPEEPKPPRFTFDPDKPRSNQKQ
jgi:hypothetical protein